MTKPIANDAAPHVAPDDLRATPGPWTVKSDFCGPLRVVAGDIDIAHVGALHFFDAQKNADLIAASPELLDSLKLAVQIAETWIHDQLDGTSSLDGALAHLKPCHDAIAKAEGRAP